VGVGAPLAGAFAWIVVMGICPTHYLETPKLDWGLVCTVRTIVGMFLTRNIPVLFLFISWILTPGNPSKNIR